MAIHLTVAAERRERAIRTAGAIRTGVHAVVALLAFAGLHDAIPTPLAQAAPGLALVIAAVVDDVVTLLRRKDG